MWHAWKPLKVPWTYQARQYGKGWSCSTRPSAQSFTLASPLHQFTLPCPSTLFTLKGTPQGSCITVASFTGVNWVSLGLLEEPGRCQPSPASRSWWLGQLTLNWGLELPAAGWMWPCKAQDAFLDREQPGEPPARPQIWPLEGWKDGRGWRRVEVGR